MKCWGGGGHFLHLVTVNNYQNLSTNQYLILLLEKCCCCWERIIQSSCWERFNKSYCQYLINIVEVCQIWIVTELNVAQLLLREIIHAQYSLHRSDIILSKTHVIAGNIHLFEGSRGLEYIHLMRVCFNVQITISISNESEILEMEVTKSTLSLC